MTKARLFGVSAGVGLATGLVGPWLLMLLYLPLHNALGISAVFTLVLPAVLWLAASYGLYRILGRPNVLQLWVAECHRSRRSFAPECCVPGSHTRLGVLLRGFRSDERAPRGVTASRSRRIERQVSICASAPVAELMKYGIVCDVEHRPQAQRTRAATHESVSVAVSGSPLEPALGWSSISKSLPRICTQADAQNVATTRKGTRHMEPAV